MGGLATCRRSLTAVNAPAREVKPKLQGCVFVLASLVPLPRALKEKVAALPERYRSFRVPLELLVVCEDAPLKFGIRRSASSGHMGPICCLISRLAHETSRLRIN